MTWEEITMRFSWSINANKGIVTDEMVEAYFKACEEY